MTRIVTPLPPGAPTVGPRTGAVSKHLGAPFIPWQLEAARLIGAVHPDEPWRWRYRLVIITVPRQSGKTTLGRAMHIDRLLWPRPNPDAREQLRVRHWMTAQKGLDARRRWRDIVERVQASPMGRFMSTRESIGSEALACGSGAALAPFAPGPTALHGETTPLVSIDEPWAFEDLMGDALLAAITPAQQTIPDAQLIMYSTVGTEQSTWWWRLCQQGRASVEDPDSPIAYVEHSADPELFDADPYGSQTFGFHPGIQGGLTSHARLLEDRERAGSLANWRRGYANLWPEGMGEGGRDVTSWRELPTSSSLPPITDCVLALDVAHDRSAATVYAAWTVGDVVHLRLVRSDAGVAWLVPWWTAIIARHGRPSRVLADAVGHTAATIAAIHRELPQLTIDPITPRQYAEACAAMLGAISDASLAHDHSELVLAGLQDVEQTSLAGGVAFHAARSPVPIDALKSATIAHWGALRPPAPIQLFG